MHVQTRQMFLARATLPLAVGSLLVGTAGDCIGGKAAIASTFTVQTCADSGAGSLRQILTNPSALSGDVVDLSHLACGTITLDTGGIFFGQNDLTIVGPGSGSLTIRPGQSTGIGLLSHTGSGTLRISGIALRDGEKYSAGSGRARGGCLYSHGNISITDVYLLNCRAYSGGSGATLEGGCAYAVGNIDVQSSSLKGCDATPKPDLTGSGNGGCLFAKGDVTVRGSTLDGCFAHDSGGNIASYGRVSLDHATIANGRAHSNGGGISAMEAFNCAYSSIVGNQTSTDKTSGGDGGGIYTNGPAFIDSCLIADNEAAEDAGIVVENGHGGTSTLINSTISGNVASGFHAGIKSKIPLTVANSTIVYNRAHEIVYLPNAYHELGSGIYLYNAVNLTLQSSIVAHNGPNALFTCDISGGPGASITGANNIVTFSLLALPLGTLSTDPMIGPLRNNGGTTQTHALLPGSPALNAGNASFSRTFDQRGSPHQRILGVRQDIGAFELDPDQIFASGFD